MNCFDKFPECFKILKRLFGDDVVSQKANRLNEIFIKCEKKWQENLDRLKGIEVKYLLIAEAAPWTAEGEVRYFYNTFDGNWVKRIWYAFYDTPFPDDMECGLNCLAKKQFLLIDSLPFSMKYSSYYRKKPLYSELVQSCSDYLIEKLNNKKLKWSKSVKLALAFKLNGKAIINAFPDGIDLPNGQTIKLCRSLIATDASNYTNSNMLKDIWCIENNRI